jgi:tetratricopeptide (TPR) repeat protein
MKSKKPGRRSETAAPAVRIPAWWRLAWAGAAAAAAAWLAYGPALNGPFVFDDQYLPFFSPHFAEQTLLMAVKGVRPFLMFSFWLNNHVAGTEPYTYHLWNLLFHFANSLLVFLATRRLLAWAGTSGPRGEWMAAFAGALFLLHPVQTESVAYVASRSENLSALFYYAALVVFLYRKSPAISWLAAAAVIALYGAAVSTKEHTVTLPALLLLTDYFWNPGFSLQGIRRNWRLYVPLAAAACAGVVIVLRLIRGSLSAGFNLTDLPWHDYFYTQCRALWVYLRLFVAPVGQNADYNYPISRSILDRGAIFGLAGLLLLVAGAVYFRKRYSLAAYGFLAALLLFAPTSSVVPIQDAVAERRLYLPMFGLVLVTVEFLRRWKTKAVVQASVLCAVLALLALACHQRNRVWASDVALWEDTVAKSPHNARAHFQLGVAYSQQGRCEAALPHYETAAKLDKKPDDRLFIDWALAEDCAGRPELAIEKLRQAAGIKPTGYAYALMGMIFGKQMNYAESHAALDMAEKLDPQDDMPHFYRGNLYAASGDFARAVQEYRRAVELNPDNEAARRGLARAESRLRQP